MRIGLASMVLDLTNKDSISDHDKIFLYIVNNHNDLDLIVF